MTLLLTSLIGIAAIAFTFVYDLFTPLDLQEAVTNAVTTSTTVPVPELVKPLSEGIKNIIKGLDVFIENCYEDDKVHIPTALHFVDFDTEDFREVMLSIIPQIHLLNLPLEYETAFVNQIAAIKTHILIKPRMEAMTLPEMIEQYKQVHLQLLQEIQGYRNALFSPNSILTPDSLGINASATTPAITDSITTPKSPAADSSPAISTPFRFGNTVTIIFLVTIVTGLTYLMN